MFFKLILENANGDRVDMTTTANQYMISKIEGLSPPSGTISTSTYAGMDGSYLNNAFIEKRNVVISFAMRGVNLEQRRHILYRVVKPSRYVKVYYKTDVIDVYAEGYVETYEISNFDALTSGQISIIIQNDGDETGFTIRIEASSDETVPEIAAYTPTIYNADTGEYLQIKGEILKGDVITITTKTGNKTVTLTRNGVDSNIINRLVSGSTWLSLREGKNTFHVQAVRGVKNLKVTLMHRNAFLGV